jgi:Domain of unknown function (DUF6458)
MQGVPGGGPGYRNPRPQWFAPDCRGNPDVMTIGTSIFLIAVGAVLKFAVTATVAGISIQTAGLILMLVGVLGLVIGLFMLASQRRSGTRETAYQDRPLYR